METILFDFDGVVSGSKIEFVIGDGGELTVDVNSGGLGVGGDTKQTGALQRTVLEIGTISFGVLDGYGCASNEENEDQKINNEAFGFRVLGHRNILHCIWLIVHFAPGEAGCIIWDTSSLN